MILAKLNHTFKVTVVASAFIGMGSISSADESANLIINEELEMITRAPAPDHLENLDEVISGWVYRADETQALQMDDFENPGMIFVEQAEDVWNTADGAAGKSCASCHGEPDSMAGLRAVTPKVNPADGKLWTLEDYVNNCRTERMEADAWKYTGGDMTSMVALISLQSRGMPMNVAIDGPAAPYWEQGKEMYYTRTGVLEMSCASCHEENYGNLIRADHLSQGQINGFPVYRLKNAKLNSVHARFKGCVRDTKAETYSPGSDEFRALELYVASRGNGLSVEGPSVRN